MLRNLLQRAALVVALLLSNREVAHSAPFDATRVVLGNGLRVVLIADSQATAVDAALWFPAGLRHEKPAQHGLAILAARTIFRSGERDAIAPLSAVGGTGDVVATSDYTSFSATVPAAELERALDFIAARTAPRPVHPQDVVAERAALQADRRRFERPPVPAAIAQLWQATWPGHPYARTGALSQGSETFAVGAVDEWRRTRFGLSGAVLTVVGAFDRDRALALVRQRFETRPRSLPPPTPALVAPQAPTRALGRTTLPVRLCLMGWRAPRMADTDAAALEILAAWLGDGPAARLPSALVSEWGLALDAQAGVVLQQQGSLLWALAVVAPEGDSVGVERAMLDAVSSVVRETPETRTVARARRGFESALAVSLQTARQRGQALGEAELLIGDGAAARRFEALSRVTPEDLRRVAARVLTDANRGVLWVLPQDGVQR